MRGADAGFASGFLWPLFSASLAVWSSTGIGVHEFSESPTASYLDASSLQMTFASISPDAMLALQDDP